MLDCGGYGVFGAQARIAFKLVWCPPSFDHFVLVDDEGVLLNTGSALTGALPPLSERERNYRATRGSKYEKAALAQGKT